MVRTVKAIGLISGGLDSTLAAALVKEQGIEVEALNFSTGFCFSDHHRAMKSPKHRLRQEALRAGSELEMPVTIIDIADEYFEEVLIAPRHGYGANMNPCLDCRSYMLGRAREAELLFAFLVKPISILEFLHVVQSAATMHDTRLAATQ